MKKPGEDHWGDDEPSTNIGSAEPEKKDMMGGTFCRFCYMNGNLHANDCPKNN